MIPMKPAKNLWPWAIILVFIIFISGTISLVVMACSQKADLVSSDYYEQEIKFQRHLDQLDQTHRLAKDASVTYDSGSRLIRIALPVTQQSLNRNLNHPAVPGAPVSFMGDSRTGVSSAPITGHIQLYRPSAAGLDRQLKLETDLEGVQFLDAASLQRGLWKVRVSWTAENTEYFLDQSIKVGG